MLLLGIDVGTSSIKVSVVDGQTRQCLVSVQYPETESPIISPQPGWAEQPPEMWWDHVQKAILKAHAKGYYSPQDIGAIGIAYQMHGLVILDKEKQPLRNSIIWCDSRAVALGDTAFSSIGEKKCLTHLLNSPGNFTASKLAWVKINEPKVYNKISHVMLPGDYISFRLTGAITSSISALSEGVFWDFQNQELSQDIFDYYGLDTQVIPSIHPVFSTHGYLDDETAFSLSLRKGIPVSYKAGDQPNNAFSLNVMEPGEVAATAGTSGVIYGISNQLTYDPESRINSFAHVNHQSDNPRIGVLLCINGTGILNQWVKKNFGGGLDYPDVNELAAAVPAGCDGLFILPFGNGAERMLKNKIIGSHMGPIQFNLHTKAHVFRAVQEGIAFAFRYGLDIMRENGMNPKVIRAGNANMFKSRLFAQVFVNATGVPVELFDCDGSVGAALGAGVGAGLFSKPKEAFANIRPLFSIEPNQTTQFGHLYVQWKDLLDKQLQG